MLSPLFPNQQQRIIFNKINYISIFNTGLSILFWLTMGHLKIYHMQHGLLIIAVSFVVIAKLNIVTRLGDKHYYHKYLRNYRNKHDIDHQNLTKTGRLQQLDAALNQYFYFQKRLAIPTIGTALILDISLILTFGLHIPIEFLGHLNGSTLQILAAISENINVVVTSIWLYQFHIIKQKAYQKLNHD